MICQLEATPLYIPLYLARYRVGGDREYTMAMLADQEHIGEAEIFIPPPPKYDE